MSTPASQALERVLLEFQDGDLETARKVAGTISETSGKCLIISSPEAVATSSPIRVQGKDLLFLGEVVQSILGNDGRWSVHMRVKSKFMIF